MTENTERPKSLIEGLDENVRLKTSANSRELDGIKIRVFLSYARVDDEMLGFVQDFSRQLKYFVNSFTNQFHLDVFVDVDSLDWGDEWPQEIEEELNAASVFIPFLSGTYLNRDNCRSEFTQFYQGAQTLGVTDLILPVMIFDSPELFSTESSDSIAAACARLNHISLAEGIRSGVGSAVWRSTLMDASEKFISAYSKAESRLAASKPLTKSVGSTDEPDDIEDQPGFLDVQESISRISVDMVSALKDMEPAISELGDVATRSAAKAPKDRRQVQQWAIRAAEEFKDPSNRIGDVGKRVLEHTSQLDIEVRSLASIIAEVPSIAGDDNDVASITSSLSNLEHVKDQLDGLLDSFKVPESMSAAVRKALRPAREGLTKITDSITIMNAWKDLN